MASIKMTHKKFIFLISELAIAAAATGAALAVAAHGLWDQSPAKVLLGLVVAGFGAWIVRRAEDEIVTGR